MEPYRNSNEYFIIQRGSIQFQIDIEEVGTLSGQGCLYLTSQRVALVNSKGGGELWAFELPLDQISKVESQNQQSVEGVVKTSGNQFGNLKFQIIFIEGGGESFM